MKKELQKNVKITYGNMVCDIRTTKQDVFRTRLTIGGDRLDYDGNSTSPEASLLETKLFINRTISDGKYGAKCITVDLKDHFLQSELKTPQYMQLHNKYFFKDIREKYDIDNIVDSDGYVYCKIIKGMYGLKEAAKLAREKIIETLSPYGYAPEKYAPNVWSHNTRETKIHFMSRRFCNQVLQSTQSKSSYKCHN